MLEIDAVEAPSFTIVKEIDAIGAADSMTGKASIVIEEIIFMMPVVNYAPSGTAFMIHKETSFIPTGNWMLSQEPNFGKILRKPTLDEPLCCQCCYRFIFGIFLFK